MTPLAQSVLAFGALCVLIVFAVMTVAEFIEARRLRLVVLRRINEGTTPAGTGVAPSDRPAHDGKTADRETTRNACPCGIC